MNNISLSVQGINIAAKAWGDPENPPLIALHGWLDNANSFAPIAPYLSQNYYLIAVDLPGHGWSDHFPESNHYHFVDGIFFIIDILDQLNYPAVHLLGHSMGACLASLVAGVVPERMLSLHLIEGLGPFSQPASSACMQLNQYLNRRLIESKAKKKYDSMEKAVHARAKRGYVSYEIAEILSERGLKEIDTCYYWRHDPRLLVPSPLQMTEEQILSCLQCIKTPSHLLLASDGFGFHPELFEKRIQAVDHLQCHKIEGGHHVHMEKPEETAKLLFKMP